MEEDKKANETVQGCGENKVVESTVDRPTNIRFGRRKRKSQGSKKLKVCVTDVTLTEFVSGISNSGSTQSQKGRGRPKLSSTKHTEQEGSLDDHSDDSEQTLGAKKGAKKPANNGDSSKKRGRPKKTIRKSTPDSAAAKDVTNGGSGTLKMGRGRPKGSTKRKSDVLASDEVHEGNSAQPRKRGRPKGSPDKKPRLLAELSSEGEAEARGGLDSENSGRGRRRLVKVNNTGRLMQDTSNGISDTPQSGRGRPRKSIEEKSTREQELVTDGSQSAKRGRGRPKGSVTEKPSGYVVLPSNKKRGRPRQQSAKRGRPRKYPNSAKSENVMSRKRGRPKGSVNKNEAMGVDNVQPSHSEEKSDLSDVKEVLEGVPVEEHNTQTIATEHSASSDAPAVKQDTDFEVSQQA